MPLHQVGSLEMHSVMGLLCHLYRYNAEQNTFSLQMKTHNCALLWLNMEQMIGRRLLWTCLVELGVNAEIDGSII
jgi:hypothetical protein